MCKMLFAVCYMLRNIPFDQDNDYYKDGIYLLSIAKELFIYTDIHTT